MEKTSVVDPLDYTLAKNMGEPSKPWRWEIYPAGETKPLQQSECFVTMSELVQAKRVWQGSGPTRPCDQGLVADAQTSIGQHYSLERGLAFHKSAAS
jgi:hypothetical protein